MGAGRVGQPGASPLAFELLAEIATGPTARVELCRVTAPREQAGRLLAVKRLHPHIAEDPHFYSMFVDEVWMTAALDHPNVTRVAGWGTDSEGTYLAVELVEGVSLARLMKTVFETREAFTERMVVYLGSRICAGLEAAHRLRSLDGEPLSLVHRDLTPGNVLLGFDGRVLIADFGLAKAKQRVTKTLTGLLKGHPQYMAPEQASDGPIDARADLFSLGVVLFELFTGRHPWTGRSELEVFHVMANEPPADLLELRPKLDKELASMVDRLLDRDPARRFQSAAEVQARLEYWLDIHGYKEENQEAVGRFVRRNAMRQQRWFERAVSGDLKAEAARAKARLLARPGAQPAPASAPPRAPPHRRQRAARRVADQPTDEATDVSDPQLAPRPSQESGETPDFSEEIPTVVKPNAPLAMAAHARRLAASGAQSAALPSFADDDSDGRTTTMSGQRTGKLRAPLTPLDTEPELRFRGGGIVDEPSEELATTPVRDKPKLPPHLLALGKLPPPPPGSYEDKIQDRPTLPRDGRPLAPPPRPSEDSWPELPDEPSTHDEPARTSAAPPAPSGDLASDLARMRAFAGELAAKADSAARLAAHRSVLAQLGAEAVAMLEEARGAEPGSARALSLVREAYRLEASARQGERQSIGDSSLDLVAAGLTPHGGGRSGRPSAPPPPPVPVHASAPPTGPILAGAAAEDRGDRTSFIPGMMPPEAMLPRAVPPAPPAPPPSLLTSEVFGIPVWLALAFAFLVALGLVILVDVVRG